MIGIVEAASLLLIILSARWQLKPLRERAANLRLPIQFELRDLLLLLVVLGLSGSIFSLLPDRDARLTVIGLVWFGLSLSWFSAVRLLSRAGVRSMPRRAVIEALALPLVFFGPLLLVLIPAGVSISSMQYYTPEASYTETYVYVLAFRIRVAEEHLRTLRIALMSCWLFILLTWMFVPRRLMRWALAASSSPQPVPAPNPGNAASDAPLLDPHVKNITLK